MTAESAPRPRRSPSAARSKTRAVALSWGVREEVGDSPDQPVADAGCTVRDVALRLAVSEGHQHFERRSGRVKVAPLNPRGVAYHGIRECSPYLLPQGIKFIPCGMRNTDYRILDFGAFPFTPFRVKGKLWILDLDWVGRAPKFGG